MWGTRPSGRDRNYVVIKHGLRGINSQIHNVKFREGYAVVDKNSKTYFQLKKFPNLRNAKEFPLTYLRSLPFITRSRDIEMVYGKDVFLSYLEAVSKDKTDKEAKDKLDREQREASEQAKREQDLSKKQEIEQKIAQLEQTLETTKEEISDIEEVQEELQKLESEIPEVTKCAYRVEAGTLCKYDAAEESPSGYCNLHVLKDPKLKELGIEVAFVPKKQLKEYREQIINKLSKLKDESKF